MSYRRIHLSLACLFAGILLTSNSLASTHFPEMISDVQQQLQLIGTGKVHYAGLISVYEATLYAPSGKRGMELLDTSVPKRLEIVYHRPIEGKMLVKAARHILQRQHEPATLARWQANIDRLHAAYGNVAVGDRFALLVVPASGLSLEFNGRELVRIQDIEFAHFYLNIWLGETPLSSSLRDALLAIDCCGYD